MSHYKIEGQVVSFAHGDVLGLTRAQAEPRLHYLVGGKLAKAHESVKRDSPKRALYTVDGVVQFKSGEVVWLEGEAPQMYAAAMVDIDARAVVVEESRAAERAREVEKEQARLQAEARHRALVDAMRDIKPSDDQGNIDIGVLTEALDGKLDFQPTVEQLEAAWAERVGAKV